MVSPKVLVGCPTSDHKSYCLNEYVKAVKELSYDNYDILLVDNSKTNEYSEKIKSLGIPVIKDTYVERAKDRIVHSRNILRTHVLNNGYDYFLSLEQDVIPPPNIIEQLLHHKNAQIVSGVYFTKYIINDTEQLKPLLWRAVDGKPDKMQFLDVELDVPQLVPIKACGLGCILIHKDVLKKIPFRLFEDKTFDDIGFCHDAAQQGFTLYAYTGAKCKHLISGMNWDVIKE